MLRRIIKQKLGLGNVGEGCILDQEIREYLIERVSFESRSEKGKRVNWVDSLENGIPGKERARAKDPEGGVDGIFSNTKEGSLAVLE